jgi:glycosyltransferase involved in cell wall biosynthesis
VQNKVLEAVAAGLPAVVTPAVHEGLPDAVRPACLVASDAAGYAEAIAQVLALLGREAACLASRACLDALTWETCLQPLAGILHAPRGPCVKLSLYPFGPVVT